MLQRQRCSLIETEALAACDDQALGLCGRLLGLVLDAENGRDLHALVRLRRGLRLAMAFLQLRRQGRVQRVSRLRAGDPDLRLEQDGGWIDRDLRPRRQAAGSNSARYRLRFVDGSPLEFGEPGHVQPEIAVAFDTRGVRSSAHGSIQFG